VKGHTWSRFDPKEMVTAYQTEFHSRRRTWGETIPDFGYAFRRLVCMAYPKDRFDDTLERLAINQSMAGLGDCELASHVNWHHKSTLESAIACAVEFEAFSASQNVNVQKPRKDDDLKFPVQAVKKSGSTEKSNSDSDKLNTESQIAELTNAL